METIYTERYRACFELYLKYGGRNLLRIERERPQSIVRPAGCFDRTYFVKYRFAFIREL